MRRFSALSRLSFRLHALTALSGLGLAILVAFALHAQWTSLRAQRVAELTASSEALAKLADFERAMVTSGKMTDEAARAEAAAQIASMVHGKGDYYFRTRLQGHQHRSSEPPRSSGWTSRSRWTAMALPGSPMCCRERCATAWRRSNTTFPRAGDTTPALKVGVYRYYEPWHWVIGTGMYLDDLKRRVPGLRIQAGWGRPRPCSSC